MLRPTTIVRTLVATCTLLIACASFLTAGGGQALAAGSGSVFVNVHVCPAGPSYTNASYATLAHVCQGDSLHLGDGNGFYFSFVTEGHTYVQRSGDLSPHAVTRDNMPAHIFTIQQKMPARFGTPVVFCQSDKGSNTFTRMQLFPGQGIEAIHPTLTAGGLLYCDWFNVRVGPLMAGRAAG